MSNWVAVNKGGYNLGNSGSCCYKPNQREAIASYWPDVVLLDLCFDNSADSGLELLAELRTSHPNLPVLVFTDKEDFANQ